VDVLGKHGGGVQHPNPQSARIPTILFRKRRFSDREIQGPGVAVDSLTSTLRRWEKTTLEDESDLRGKIGDRGQAPRGSQLIQGQINDIPKNQPAGLMRVETIQNPLQLLTLTMLALMPGVVAGQSVVVDEGIFEILINGRRAGTEDFIIRRSGVGPNVQMIATAEITITTPGERLDLRPALQVVGRVMTVSAYQIKISGSRKEEVFVTPGNGRFLLRMRSDRGDQERELRMAPGTFLLDTNVAHQYYFLSQRLLVTNRPLPIIVPREARQYEFVVTDSARESVQIAGQTVDSRHLRLSVGQEIREIWVDLKGKVLKVTDSSSGYTAVRTTVP